MRKWKYKRTFAGFLAVVLLLQMIPESVLAEKMINVEPTSLIEQTNQEITSQEINTYTSGDIAETPVNESELPQQSDTVVSDSENTSAAAEPSIVQSQENVTETTASSEVSSSDDSKQDAPEQEAPDQNDSEENPTNEIIQETPNQDETENDTEEELEETSTEEADEIAELENGIKKNTDGEIVLENAEDFITLSNLDASFYYKETIRITRSGTDALDLTQEIAGKKFQGFGSENCPFQGNIKITSGTSSKIDIVVDHSFFNYLAQSAMIETGLYLKAKKAVTGALLAEHFVQAFTSEETGTEEQTSQCSISLTICAETSNDGNPSFSGIIGTMDANTNLVLSVTDETNTSSTSLSITGSNNIGFFCNTIETGASLTIQSYNKSGTNDATISYNISSTGGHAGGLVGAMKENSSLTINQALSLTGSVTATGAVTAAGGLVGLFDKATITIADSVASVTCSEIVKGTSESGGYIGKAVYRNTGNTENTLDLSKVILSNLTIAGGNHSGGFFGVLNYDSAGGTLTIQNAGSNGSGRITHTGTSDCWQFGGVIGQYSANSLSSTLKLENSNVAITENGIVTALGGVIGSLARSDANDVIAKATTAYVEIENATVNATIGDTGSVNVNGDGSFGGLVGEVADIGGQGHFLSVSGTTTISGADNSKSPRMGGLLGKGINGVLRISGTTNLSGFTFGATGTECGQIAGAIDGTIVYAMGSGNGNGGDGYDWKFIRPNSVPVSDIGSYGEVIRLDGTSLIEGGSSDTTLFNFDASNHVFGVAYRPQGAPTVSSKRDLAALAILIQKDKASDLLGQAITIDTNLVGQTIDLSGTGIYSLLRDNGSQVYTGTFNGNGCTINVAAGEAYGYMSDGTTLAQNVDGNSATVGIGQLYNHSTIGFLPYCNGTVQNLTLEGSIYFHNVSNGAAVRCGAVTGYTDGGDQFKIDKVTVNTNIVYRDGNGGDSLAMITIGGFVGLAKGKITFNDCSMQGSISSASGCHDFALGGYLAMGGETENAGVDVTFTNCKISNAKIEHTQFTESSNAPDAYFGGLIGRMVGRVTVNGLTIDGLAMSSYATGTSGGLFGYQWLKKNDDAGNTSDSVTITGVTIKNSTLDVKGKFGGLIYRTDEYWKIGDGTAAGSSSEAAPKGIHFEASNETANKFSGKTDESNPSALLICSTITTDDPKDRKDKAYIEIRVDGLVIDENAVAVTLDGNYFDDIVGKTKYGEDGYNAVLSIGLTEWSAATATLIDQNEGTGNTWQNRCQVNSNSNYTNENTRYYYNVDYYRKQVKNTEVTDIDTPGKLLLRSLYVYGHQNLQQYFVKGSDDLKLTGTIDLTGVSYYPMARALTIKNATITFDYATMNVNANKKYNDANAQHYQMQTGLFSKITQKFTVTNLKLCGTFGKYEDEKAGVLICDTIGVSTNTATQAGVTIKELTLDGIQCSYEDKNKYFPLLINSVGSNTSISMDTVTFTRDKYKAESRPVAQALMGAVGSETAEKISLEFANMDLNKKEDKEHLLFKVAIFATEFRYGDGASSGTYNFEKATENITYGKEISNGFKQTGYNRNSYDKEKVTGQVWYFDTFGENVEGSYVGEDRPADSPQDFSSYLPYIGVAESNNGNYHELDVNQRSVYLVDGCGTYGHPWIIKDVSRTDDNSDSDSSNPLFTGEDQMMTVMKLLEGTSPNGVALKINKNVLKTKLKGQEEITPHSGEDDRDDVVIIKKGDNWVEAKLVGKRYQATDEAGAYSESNENVMAYLRNGYFYIKQDLTLDISKFTGFGKDDVSYAFSGVIIGDKENMPTITLTGTNMKGQVGGLICYSQGSVVKNLNIKLDNVTFKRDELKLTENFFGGVIGRVIGGDNIIDNVNVISGTVNVEGTNSELAAVGGYVGMVGGYESKDPSPHRKKGGGVVFRNISSEGLTSIGSQNTTTEADEKNTKYYWNPYVGRVFDGYACAEAANCPNMGTNTDKNYKIPKLNSNDKLKITGNNSTTRQNVTIYPNSTITLDSNQAIWLLSAIVNSGFGAKSGSKNLNEEEEPNIMNASYYGRTRIGQYDGVGSSAYSNGDSIDENDYWGGMFDKKIKTITDKDNKVTATYVYDDISHVKPSTSYLSTYVDANNLSAQAVMYSLTTDIHDSDKNVGGKSIVFEKKNTSASENDIDYDLTEYGNGFRGIGYNYGYIGTLKEELFTRALRLKNQNDIQAAVDGNNAIICYQRTINECDSTEDVHASEAGFFTQCIANSTADYTVKNLHFKNVVLTKNCFQDYLSLGVVFARDGVYSPKSLTFDNVTVRNSKLDQGDWSAALLGYMSSNTKNIAINFNNCSVSDFTAGTSVSNDANKKMNHCGAFIGRSGKPASGASSTTRTITFTNCTTTNIELYNVQNGGSFAGHIMESCNVIVIGGSASGCTITSRTSGSSGYSMGGLIGKAESNLTVKALSSSETQTTATSIPVTVSDIKINGTTDINKKDITSYAGGLAGYVGGASNIQNTIVKDAKLVGKNLGGVIGSANSSVSMQNIEVRDSYLANCKDQKERSNPDVGGLVGTVNDTFSGFNLLSNNNIVGYYIDPKGSIPSGFNSSNFNNLSADNIGLPISTANKGTYVSYRKLASDSTLTLNTSTSCGIWVGNANGNVVQLVSVSRQGDYSAINNIGTGISTGRTKSYVIYADYTGAATKIPKETTGSDNTDSADNTGTETTTTCDASKINVKPDAVLTVGSDDSAVPLTGDGATMITLTATDAESDEKSKTAVRDVILNKQSSLMEGYHGGDQNRSLDNIAAQFGSKGEYVSRLSTYKKEEEKFSGASDFPILILNATTKSKLNSIVNNYISLLTNAVQTQTSNYYESITPTTYCYSENTWTTVSEDEKTMTWSKADGIQINRGKYDNNKNQITVLDVLYCIHWGASDAPDAPKSSEYHLYIPVLVKKLMDVECSVKIVNGAVGYDFDQIYTNATLNSFGENYTAQISYTYKWMVSEWNSMLENGDSLLWNFDKTVSLGEFNTLDRDKIHLTVVDLNTHGSQVSYHQSTLGDLEKNNMLQNAKLDLEAMAKNSEAPYICDLLPLQATESTTGAYKIVDAPKNEEIASSNAVLRIWDKETQQFIYYAPKSNADEKEEKYYAITLNTKCKSNEILPVTEKYYLIMNCTQGSDTTPMINTKVELNTTYNNKQIPTRITGTTQQNYILGDFYKIEEIKLESNSTNSTTEMKSGSNDTIKVTVSSAVATSMTDEKKKQEFGYYVNGRSIYYQYFVQMVDQSDKPVDMKGVVSVASLTIKKTTSEDSTGTKLTSVTDLDVAPNNSFVAQRVENGYLITIKALGRIYTDSSITAELDFSYSSADLNEQFPVHTGTSSDTSLTGVQFKASAVMAYQQESLGSSCITDSTKPENKLYYRIDEAQAKLSYDSYNVTTETGGQNWDGNTSQLGINGRENSGAAMEIKSRALFDASSVSGLNLTDASSKQYPYYLEGELTLSQKDDEKSYKIVSIGSYLSDFTIKLGDVPADTASPGLGIQSDGSFKFRISLTADQVAKIKDAPLLVNISYKVKTGKDLEDTDGGTYANYKVTLSVHLANEASNQLTASVSDYLVYTNAKVYLGIIGAGDTD